MWSIRWFTAAVLVTSPLPSDLLYQGIYSRFSLFAFRTSGWRIPDECHTIEDCCCCHRRQEECHQCLVTGKITPSSTTKEGTVQFSASWCTDKSMLTEQQALSRLSRENRGDKDLKRRKGGNAWELGCLVSSLKCVFQVKTCDLLFKFMSLRESRDGLRLMVVLVCMISENQV